MFQHRCVTQLYFAAALSQLVDGLIITSPTSGEQVSLAKPFVITWKGEEGDADAVSIDLLNTTALNPTPILENIAHNLNTSSGQVNITWPYSIPNDTATYELYFIATASGDDIANSGFFNLTLPAGESRGQAEGTVGPYGSHPDTDYPSTTATHKLHGGAIAGIVIGCVALVGLCILGLLYFLRRRRKQRATATEDEKHDKPELDGVARGHRREKTVDTILSSELDGAFSDMDRKHRIDSGELEGDAQNYLRYELPSTPPPPAELEVHEIPAVEMPTPDPAGGKDASPERIGDWPIRESHGPVPRHTESARSERTGAMSVRSGSTTLGGRDLTFSEALQEIVSQELRRKE